jgi:CrcB protein
MLVNLLLVGIGGGIGTLFRALLSNLSKKIWHGDYPAATFFINISGSFFLGLLFHYHKDDYLMLLFGTGLMGGYTTFSTFNYELISFIRDGKRRTFLLYYSMSVVCGLAAAALGVFL